MVKYFFIEKKKCGRHLYQMEGRGFASLVLLLPGVAYQCPILWNYWAIPT